MAGIGFDEYFSAAKDAGTATRNSINLLILVLGVMTCIFTNVFGFRFAANRMNKMVIAFQCIHQTNSSQDAWNATIETQSSDGKNQSTACRSVLQWAKDNDLPTTYESAANWSTATPLQSSTIGPLRENWDKAEIERVYRETIGQMSGKRMDLRTFQIPVFGSVIDLQLLGLVSGISILSILLIILFRLGHERQLVHVALSYCQGKDDTSIRRRELVTYVQVFANPHASQAVSLMPYAVFAYSFVIQALIIMQDWTNRDNTRMLVGGTRTVVLFGAELLLGIGILLGAARAAINWREYRRLFNP